MASSADATALATQCQELWGNVELAPNISGTITLDGIKSIAASLESTTENGGFQLTGIDSLSLLQIGVGLNLTAMSMLQSVSFPNLQSIGAILALAFLPSLKTINFSSLRSTGGQLLIQDVPELEVMAISPDLASPTNLGLSFINTGLASINGFISSGGSVNIINNTRLSQVDLQITNTNVTLLSNDEVYVGTGYVKIIDNAPSVNISLPNLMTTAGSIAFGNCSELSIPALSIVGGDFVIINASFSSLTAPNLSLINGTLNVTGSFTG